MDTKEIYNHLNEEKYIKCFKGVYPRDLLPEEPINERPFCVIMNTDPSTRPGEHWVVLFVNKENKLEYFDSFAHPPLYEEIGNFMEINNVKEFKYNTRPLQNVMSSTCGVYCILFVKLRCEGLSFDGFIDFFSNNTIKNDIKAFVSLYLN